MKIEKIVLTKPTIKDIVSYLNKYGICIIKNYFSKKDLKLLEEDFNKILDFSQKYEGVNQHKHPINEDGKVGRIEDINKAKKYFKNSIELFHSDFMQEVSQVYFGDIAHTLNQAIFFTHEKPSQKPILPWHFDRIQSLKFYTYLTDTDKKNGAFEYVLGSHREGALRANYYIAQGIPIELLPNDIPDEEVIYPTTISAKAGDLLIFTPDGIHRGGIVHQGFERKVIRGHTYLNPMRGYGENNDPKEFADIKERTEQLIKYRIEHFGRVYKNGISHAVTRSQNKNI